MYIELLLTSGFDDATIIWDSADPAAPRQVASIAPLRTVGAASPAAPLRDLAD